MPQPDWALRRIVAQLSAMDAEDVAAILASLNPTETRIVEELLRQCAEPPAPEQKGPEPKVKPSEAAFDAGRISPWLVELLDGAKSGSISPRARQVMRDHAVRLYPAPAGPVESARGAQSSARVRLFRRRRGGR